jgi:hypothetical protein
MSHPLPSGLGLIQGWVKTPSDGPSVGSSLTDDRWMTAAAEDGAQVASVVWRWSRWPLSGRRLTKLRSAPYCRVGPRRQPFPSSNNRE